MADVKFIFGVVAMLAFFAYLNTLLPAEYQFINTFDFAWLGGGIVGIAGTCVIATGLPCAVALGVFGFVSVWAYVIVSNEIIKLLVFTPILITVIYIVSKMARGNG